MCRTPRGLVCCVWFVVVCKASFIGVVGGGAFYAMKLYFKDVALYCRRPKRVQQRLMEKKTCINGGG